MSRHLHLTAALGCLLAASVPAQAAVISGSFMGTVSSGTYESGPATFVDLAGSSVTGSFTVNSVEGATPPNLGTPYFLPSDAFTYSFFFAAVGQTFSFGNIGTNAVYLQDDGTTQGVTLQANYASGGPSPNLTLTGPEGSLFTTVNDITTLHAGAGVSLVSPIFFGTRFPAIGATISVTSQSISPSGQSVPEPPGWSVLGACLAALAGASGLWRHQAGARLSRRGQPHLV